MEEHNNNSGRPPGGGDDNKNPRNRQTILMFLIVALVGILFWNFVGNMGASSKEITYNEFLDMLEKEEVDLYDLTREIVSRLAPQAAQKNIHMEVTGEPVIYKGIRQILDEMVYNICENAIKYNNDNGRVTVWVGSTLSGPKISVADTGIGIPKEHQERIFERFYRVDKSHSKERGGTGLGLSIVKHGAILHGAKVNVESDEGKGTRMEILFTKN